MKPYLFFLGSGASVPFGLPTMSEMVKQFEETLQNNTPMQKDYNIAKLILKLAYEYEDIESIFSVVDMIGRDVQYTDLGFDSAYIFTLVGVRDLKEKAFTRRQVETSNELTKVMKEFVRMRCRVEDSTEVDEKINQIYGKLFEAACGKYSVEKSVQSGKLAFFDPQCPIYTTNYDVAVESYFQGRSYINDLWKDENNIDVRC